MTGNDVIEWTPADPHECVCVKSREKCFYGEARVVQIVMWCKKMQSFLQ